MSRHIPIVFEWREVDVSDPKTGEVQRAFAMVPLERMRGIAARQFEAGHEYRAETWIIGGDVRSTAQHKRYFAALREAYDQLPEAIVKKRPWPTAEHFRAWLLIETKWCTEKEIECADEKSAKRLATFVRSESPYARIKVFGRTVMIWTALSQDYATMDKESFKKSSNEVLELAAAFIQVPRGTLLRNAERSA